MQTQHTPAPWYVKDRQVYGTSTAHGSATIAYIQDLVEAQANAHLIAAAPELLEECEKTYTLLVKLCNLLPTNLAGAAAIRADLIQVAIQKAKGV